MGFFWILEDIKNLQTYFSFTLLLLFSKYMEQFIIQYFSFLIPHHSLWVIWCQIILIVQQH